jgi:hypothetical protein
MGKELSSTRGIQIKYQMRQPWIDRRRAMIAFG